MSKKFLYFSLVYFILCCVNFSYEKFNTIDSSGIKESEITLILKSDLPFNPLRLQTVFLKDVPEDVRYVRCHISFENSVSDENFVKEHETFYPLIKQDGLQSFFNMNFFWMFDQKTLGTLESMDNTETIKFMNELPEEVEITISYDRSLSPYYELLKVDYDENSGERFASVFCDLPNGKIRLNETEHSNKYAIVFIHGVQGGQLKSVLSNFSTPPYGWRNYDRKNYWSVFYDGSLLSDFPDLSMDDFDFYEYQYDSYFDTSSGYGQKLALLLEKSGILDEYEKTILISHSMGTVVARFALNEFIPERGVYVGDEIDRLMLIGGLLEGSFFSNLSDPMVLHSKSMAVSGVADYQYDFNFENISVLYKLLNAAFDYRKLLFSPESIVDIFQTITDFYFGMPIIAGGLFSSFSDIPFMGGQLVLFPGMASLRYTDEPFLESLSTNLLSGDESFIRNKELHELNSNDRFKEKEIIFSSHILNENAFLSGLNTFSILAGGLLSSQNTSAEDDESWYITGSIYPELNIPLIKFMVQRALCKIISDFAKRIGEEKHSGNDGFVTLWSQEMGSQNDPELKIVKFTDMDHAQVKETRIVTEKVFEEMAEFLKE